MGLLLSIVFHCIDFLTLQNNCHALVIRDRVTRMHSLNIWKGCWRGTVQVALSGQMAYKKPFELLHSWDFGFRGQWSGYRNSFCQRKLLTMTLWPFILSFNVQFRIPEGSYWLFSFPSTSVDGCYLYIIIIIHYGMSWRDWGIRLAPRTGRPDLEFKAIDTYTWYKESY